MKSATLKAVSCPSCKAALQASVDSVWGRNSITGQDDLWEGLLRCGGCDSIYPVIAGVSILIPDLGPYLSARPRQFWEIVKSLTLPEVLEHINKSAAVASATATDRYAKAIDQFLYLHYDGIRETDLLSDGLRDRGIDTANKLSYRNLLSNVSELVSIRKSDASLSVDVGCAVGGMTHLLASKTVFSLGIDQSFEAVLAARTAAIKGKCEFDIECDGMVSEHRSVDLANVLRPNTDFIVADSSFLPIGDDTVDIASSVNVYSVVAHPLVHLEELGRILRKDGNLLFVDAYDWIHTSLANPREWIGGKYEGSLALRSEAALRDTLKDHVGLEIEREVGPLLWVSRFGERHYSLWVSEGLVAKKTKTLRTIHTRALTDERHPRAFFDEVGNSDRDRLEGTVQKTFRLESTKRFLARNLPGHYHRILEAGPGPGTYSALLRGMTDHLVLMDISKTMLRLSIDRASCATTRDSIHVSGIVGDASTLGAFRDGSFNAIVMIGVVGFLGVELKDVFESASRTLTPGGLLILEGVSPSNLLGYHISQRPESLKELLGDSGRRQLDNILGGKVDWVVSSGEARVRFRYQRPHTVLAALQAAGLKIVDSLAVGSIFGSQKDLLESIRGEGRAWCNLMDAEEVIGRWPECLGVGAAYLIAARTEPLGLMTPLEIPRWSL